MPDISKQEIKEIADRAENHYSRDMPLKERVARSLKDEFPNIKQELKVDYNRLFSFVMDYIEEREYRESQENVRVDSELKLADKPAKKKTFLEEAKEMAAVRGDDELDESPYEKTEWWGAEGLTGYKGGIRK